jgi:hypothetical protein
MSTVVAVNTYTHSVTYVTDKLLSSIKNIIRMSGLSPEKLTGEWGVLERGLKVWLANEQLEQVILEVYMMGTTRLVGRWDFEVYYGFHGDGAFWMDPDILKYHIQKHGLWPSQCDYAITVTTKSGSTQVSGWGPATLLSTEGFVKQSIGTVLDGSGLSSGAGYWRKVRT